METCRDIHRTATDSHAGAELDGGLLFADFTRKTSSNLVVAGNLPDRLAAVEYILSRPLEWSYPVSLFLPAGAEAIVVFGLVSPAQFERPYPLRIRVINRASAAWISRNTRLPVLVSGGRERQDSAGSHHNA